MKYKLSIPFAIYVEKEVEADSEDEALEQAYEVSLTNYGGNGGTSKLVGTYCHSDIECDDQPMDHCDYKITATPVDQDLVKAAK